MHKIVFFLTFLIFSKNVYQIHNILLYSFYKCFYVVCAGEKYLLKELIAKRESFSKDVLFWIDYEYHKDYKSFQQKYIQPPKTLFSIFI